MSKRKTNLTVGQELLFVSGRRYIATQTVTIKTIGRCWAKLSNGYRIDIDTLDVDGGPGFNSPGRCWLSQHDYEQHTACAKAWDELKKFVRDRWAIPPGISLDGIMQAQALLGMLTESADTDQKEAA
jgi:hypothetical protein